MQTNTLAGLQLDHAADAQAHAHEQKLRQLYEQQRELLQNMPGSIYSTGVASGLANAANTRGITASQLNQILQNQAGAFNTQASQLNQILQNQAGAFNTQASPVFDPNRHPAFVMSLQMAKDMWTVRWGDKWVNRSSTDFRTDEQGGKAIWPALAERLHDADCMERHHDWWRIKD
jgi:hypothetical protein